MMKRENLTDNFLHYLVEKSHSMSAEALQAAETCVIDFIACSACGSKSSGLATMYVGESAKGNASVIGWDKLHLPAEQAAFANAFNTHSTELDDGHRFGMTHIGACVVSAVMAFAQERSLDFHAVRKGIVMGYETTARLAMAINPDHKKRGFHTTGTCGGIGAAIGCAFAADYDFLGLKRTLSVAATSAAGLLEIQEDASELKPINAAHAAMVGILAAKVGGTQMVAPEDVLGGERGFVNLMAGSLDLDKLLGRDGQYEIQRRYMKIYAACRHCHPSIEAALKAKSNAGRGVGAIKSILIETYALAIKGHDHKNVLGMQSAKLSIPFSVAVALLFGKVDESTLASTDTRLYDIMSKMTVVENKEYTDVQQKKRIAKVVLEYKDGVCVEAQVEYAKGDPENPVSIEELEQKLDNCLLLTGISSSAIWMAMNENDFEKLMSII